MYVQLICQKQTKEHFGWIKSILEKKLRIIGAARACPCGISDGYVLTEEKGVKGLIPNQLDLPSYPQGENQARLSIFQKILK